MLNFERDEEKKGRGRTHFYLLDFQQLLFSEKPCCLSECWGVDGRKSGEKELFFATEAEARQAACDMVGQYLQQGYRLASAIDPWFSEVLAGVAEQMPSPATSAESPSRAPKRDIPASNSSGQGPVIYASNHLPVLLAHLADALSAGPLPPLESEVLVVPSYGMSRWLTLQLARKLGVAASLSLPFPGAFFSDLAALILDEEPEAKDPVGERNQMSWHLFGVLPTFASRPGFEHIETYLADDPHGRKRFQLATRIAACFDEYQVYRSDVLLSWQAGTTGSAAHEAWQADLWRELVHGSSGESQASRLVRLHERLARGPRPSGLPARVGFFAPAPMPPLFLDLIGALARHIPVAIYYLNPTFHYWGDLSSRRQRQSQGDLPENALLASMGTNGRNFFLMLQDLDADGNGWTPLEFVTRPPQSMLDHLQHDVLEMIDRRPGGDEDPLTLDPADRSLRVHRCHSPLREMEVLRDQLLDAFETDTSLAPHDVLVLVPDITVYAPFVQAVFGLEHETAPRLPYAIADRSLREVRPLMDTLMRVLHVATGRFGVAEVLDLLEEPAVRRRFGIAMDDLPALRNWAESTRIRWGKDGRQRQRDYDLPPLEANTWRRGLDRLLLGYATGQSDQLVAGLLPHGEATTSRATLLGAFSQFTETLFRYQPRLSRPKPLADWAMVLNNLLVDLFSAGDEEEEETLQLVRDAFAEMSVAGAEEHRAEPVSAVVIHEHLAGLFAYSGGGGGFISGAITFCALKPMRTIPYKVICIAGLNESDFPRRQSRPGFSLLNAAPRRGDRAPRDEDRFLFLETVMAARDRLILSFVGRSLADNSDIAPAVVVSELLDYLDTAFRHPDGGKLRDLLLVDHPLQAFSRSCFNGADPEIFSYSRENYEGIVGPAAVGDSARLKPFISGPLEINENEPAVALRDLIAFWQNPCKFFCREVLRLALYNDNEAQHEAEPFSLSALEAYNLDKLLVDRRLRGSSAEEPAYIAAEDILPLAGLGQATYERHRRDLDLFTAELSKYRFDETRHIEIRGDDWNLTGVITNLGEAGRIQFRPARIKAKDLVAAWICHLAVNAQADLSADPRVRNSLVLGLERRGSARALSRLAFVPLDNARDLLTDLINAYRQGRRQPPPLFEGASHAFVAGLEAGGKSDPLKKARSAWFGDERRRGDTSDPYVRLCFRGRDPLTDEVSEFEAWARRFWQPLLAHSREVDA